MQLNGAREMESSFSQRTQIAAAKGNDEILSQADYFDLGINKWESSAEQRSLGKTKSAAPKHPAELSKRPS